MDIKLFEQIVWPLTVGSDRISLVKWSKDWECEMNIYAILGILNNVTVRFSFPVALLPVFTENLGINAAGI
jgi:hypothetical protein